MRRLGKKNITKVCEIPVDKHKFIGENDCAKYTYSRDNNCNDYLYLKDVDKKWHYCRNPLFKKSRLFKKKTCRVKANVTNYGVCSNNDEINIIRNKSIKQYNVKLQQQQQEKLNRAKRHQYANDDFSSFNSFSLPDRSLVTTKKKDNGEEDNGEEYNGEEDYKYDNEGNENEGNDNEGNDNEGNDNEGNDNEAASSKETKRINGLIINMLTNDTKESPIFPLIDEINRNLSFVEKRLLNNVGGDLKSKVRTFFEQELIPIDVTNYISQNDERVKMKTLINEKIMNTKTGTSTNSTATFIRNFLKNSTKIQTFLDILLDALYPETVVVKSGGRYKSGTRTTKKSGTKKSGTRTTKKSGTITTKKSGTRTTKKSGTRTTKKSGIRTTKKSGIRTTKKSGIRTTKKSGTNKSGIHL